MQMENAAKFERKDKRMRKNMSYLQNPDFADKKVEIQALINELNKGLNYLTSYATPLWTEIKNVAYKAARQEFAKRTTDVNLEVQNANKQSLTHLLNYIKEW